jgi:hypothetical protein
LQLLISSIQLPNGSFQREREEMKTENLWGIVFSQQRNFFNFKLMINQQKNYQAFEKIKSQKATKNTY